MITPAMDFLETIVSPILLRIREVLEIVKDRSCWCRLGIIILGSFPLGLTFFLTSMLENLKYPNSTSISQWFQRSRWKEGCRDPAFPGGPFLYIVVPGKVYFYNYPQEYEGMGVLGT